MSSSHSSRYDAAVVISADTEWATLLEMLLPASLHRAPLGAFFEVDLGLAKPTLFFHGGWGKIAAAASTSFILERWGPRLLVNVGTCGGFDTRIEPGTIVLAERTVVYDIVEQMGDADAAVEQMATDIDLTWLREPYPQQVRRALLVSADRDLDPAEVPRLIRRWSAVAGDWESGAIAWVAARYGARCLILRGVTDLVGAERGTGYGDGGAAFRDGVRDVFGNLVPHLADWIAAGLSQR